MKSADWKNVKVGTTLILATVFRGVFRVRVTEIDVKIAVDHPTFHQAQPYGLTKDRGVVKIMVGETVELANLSDLIKFKTALFNSLTHSYDRYRAYQNSADAYKEVFQNSVNSEKAK